MYRKRKRVVLELCLGWMLLLMGLISVEGMLPQLFVYNATASVPIGWYLLLPPQDVARDDMVVFTVPKDVQIKFGRIIDSFMRHRQKAMLTVIGLELMAIAGAVDVIVYLRRKGTGRVVEEILSIDGYDGEKGRYITHPLQ